MIRKRFDSKRFSKRIGVGIASVGIGMGYQQGRKALRQKALAELKEHKEQRSRGMEKNFKFTEKQLKIQRFQEVESVLVELKGRVAELVKPHGITYKQVLVFNNGELIPGTKKYRDKLELRGFEKKSVPIPVQKQIDVEVKKTLDKMGKIYKKYDELTGKAKEQAALLPDIKLPARIERLNVEENRQITIILDSLKMEVDKIIIPYGFNPNEVTVAHERIEQNGINRETLKLEGDKTIAFPKEANIKINQLFQLTVPKLDAVHNHFIDLRKMARTESLQKTVSEKKLTEQIGKLEREIPGQASKDFATGSLILPIALIGTKIAQSVRKKIGKRKISKRTIVQPPQVVAEKPIKPETEIKLVEPIFERKTREQAEVNAAKKTMIVDFCQKYPRNLQRSVQSIVGRLEAHGMQLNEENLKTVERVLQEVVGMQKEQFALNPQTFFPKIKEHLRKVGISFPRIE